MYTCCSCRHCCLRGLLLTTPGEDRPALSPAAIGRELLPCNKCQTTGIGRSTLVALGLGTGRPVALLLLLSPPLLPPPPPPPLQLLLLF